MYDEKIVHGFSRDLIGSGSGQVHFKCLFWEICYLGNTHVSLEPDLFP
jgi:hypothetical protein